jgi:hypothetical protein
MMMSVEQSVELAKETDSVPMPLSPQQIPYNLIMESNPGRCCGKLATNHPVPEEYKYGDMAL